MVPFFLALISRYQKKNYSNKNHPLSGCWHPKEPYKTKGKLNNKTPRSMRNEWWPLGHCAKKKLFLIDFNYSIITIRRIVRCFVEYLLLTAGNHGTTPHRPIIHPSYIRRRCESSLDSLRKQLIDQTSWESCSSPLRWPCTLWRSQHHQLVGYFPVFREMLFK